MNKSLLCRKGKFRRQFKGSLTAQSEVDRSHVDTKVKVDVPSIKGHKFFLAIVKECSRYSSTFSMASKKGASELVLN